MNPSAYYPYRSEAVRDSCFEYLDSLAARQWPVDSDQRTVPTAFGPTFVRISGGVSAPPLVLLHGAGGTSLMWWPNVKALSTEYRTIAVDQIGDFGRSLCTRLPQTMNDFSAWLNDLFAALELPDRVNLMGISYGGAIAAEYALHFPERLNKLILLAPGATVLRLNTRFLVRLLLSAAGKQRTLPSLIRWMFTDMARKDPAWIDHTIELLLTNMRSLERRRIAMPKVWSDVDWQRLSVPTLFLVGEHEVIYPAKKAAARLRRTAPSVTAEIVADAGHDLTFAQAETVNLKVLEFLRGEKTLAATN